MRWIQVVILTGLSAGIAAVDSRAQTEDGGKSAEAAVLARLGEIQAAAEALDPDGVFRYVLDFDRGALVQNGRYFLTRTEALESTRRGLSGLASVTYGFDRQLVTLLSPTVALVTGEGRSEAATTDGRSFSTRFAQSVVLVLTNGEWMVIHSHRSFPPAQ